MKRVIQQNCGKAETVEQFYDWKAGQESIAGFTGFEYAMYNVKTKKITGFYDIEHDPEKLARDQKSIFV